VQTFERMSHKISHTRSYPQEIRGWNPVI